MQQPGPHERHRNQTGEISRKHGNTLVRTLRRIYGESFAAGEPETAKLSPAQADQAEPVGADPRSRSRTSGRQDRAARVIGPAT